VSKGNLSDVADTLGFHCKHILMYMVSSIIGRTPTHTHTHTHTHTKRLQTAVRSYFRRAQTIKQQVEYPRTELSWTVFMSTNNTRTRWKCDDTVSVSCNTHPVAKCPDQNIIVSKLKISRLETLTFLICVNLVFGSGAHPVSYPVGTGCCFPGGKAVGEWSRSLTSI
jgi:hypothetical protein